MSGKKFPRSRVLSPVKTGQHLCQLLLQALATGQHLGYFTVQLAIPGYFAPESPQDGHFGQVSKAPDPELRLRALCRLSRRKEGPVGIQGGKEIIDSIDLLHSAYYARPEFVRTIARFLARGETPPPNAG